MNSFGRREWDGLEVAVGWEFYSGMMKQQTRRTTGSVGRER